MIFSDFSNSNEIKELCASYMYLYDLGFHPDGIYIYFDEDHGSYGTAIKKEGITITFSLGKTNISKKCLYEMWSEFCEVLDVMEEEFLKKFISKTNFEIKPEHKSITLEALKEQGFIER